MEPLAMDAPEVTAAIEAISSGHVERLRTLLQRHPQLATARLTAPGATCTTTRTLLHVVTDWPGHPPNGPATIAELVQAGADVNARFGGPHTETPLHWAASTDDVPALDALLDAGADIDAAGAVIGGGSPLSDAVAFGQWNAARRLVERGATTNLWEAAALGLLDRVIELAAVAPTEELTRAFWCACHGGQRTTAEHLLDRGAVLDWVGYDELTPLGAALRSGADDVAAWLLTRGA